jgi:hypothetical protein
MCSLDGDIPLCIAQVALLRGQHNSFCHSSAPVQMNKIFLFTPSGDFRPGPDAMPLRGAPPLPDGNPIWPLHYVSANEWLTIEWYTKRVKERFFFQWHATCFYLEYIREYEEWQRENSRCCE